MVDETNAINEQPEEFEEWKERNRIAFNVVHTALEDFLQTCYRYDIDPETLCVVLSALQFELTRNMSKDEKDAIEHYGEQYSIWLNKEVLEHQKKVQADILRRDISEGRTTIQVFPFFRE